MRHIKVKRHPNPTGLSVNDREVAIDVLRSYRQAVDRERWRARWLHNLRPHQDMPLSMERDCQDRVYRAAMNQLIGRQKGEGTLFKLEREVPAGDLAYVRQSLGM